jgi:hypothetical protein
MAAAPPFWKQVTFIFDTSRQPALLRAGPPLGLTGFSLDVLAIMRRLEVILERGLFSYFSSGTIRLDSVSASWLRWAGGPLASQGCSLR